VLEQRRDREPVRKCTHHAAFGGGTDVLQPGILLLQGERHDEDHRHEHQHSGGQAFHFR
jgi:hypothetical protein